ncbi:hypothetical protein OEZ60_21860 [Defluviimonas sp. WL0024]|uniref:Uncharacterized protein n=1 Tax=Albidovulum salinarum TaxID=2984153 RepID=A0ABT2X9J5_9RHOB|nr:hypothetical protein [Defluviimonas sp. WL0024]MCU9850617.1 hypothetical protein [Defluviimonas sp. WL0024]
MAIRIGVPLNRLLTVRTNALRLMGTGGVFRRATMADSVRDFLELNRKWFQHRGIPWAAVWVREYSKSIGEHFHMQYHQVAELDREYLAQLEEWTDELLNMGPFGSDVVGQSVENSWQVKRCRRGNQSGPSVARYLGKAEPNEITTGWGKVKPNERKLSRKHGGGLGLIDGAGQKEYRWGTSRNIGPAARNRAGLLA